MNGNQDFQRDTSCRKGHLSPSVEGQTSVLRLSVELCLKGDTDWSPGSPVPAKCRNSTDNVTECRNAHSVNK